MKRALALLLLLAVPEAMAQMTTTGAGSGSTALSGPIPPLIACGNAQLDFTVACNAIFTL